MATYQKSKTPEAAEIKRERQAEAAREGAAAMAEYQADLIATRERTAKLRALRLAQEAKIAQAPKAVVPSKSARASKTGVQPKTSGSTARAKKTTSVNRAKKAAPVKKTAAKKAASR